MFAVESIVKRRVRKVTDIDSAKKQQQCVSSFSCGTFEGDTFFGGRDATLDANEKLERLNEQNCEANLVI